MAFASHRHPATRALRQAPTLAALTAALMLGACGQSLTGGKRSALPQQLRPSRPDPGRGSIRSANRRDRAAEGHRILGQAIRGELARSGYRSKVCAQSQGHGRKAPGHGRVAAGVDLPRQQPRARQRVRAAGARPRPGAGGQEAAGHGRRSDEARLARDLGARCRACQGRQLQRCHSLLREGLDALQQPAVRGEQPRARTCHERRAQQGGIDAAPRRRLGQTTRRAFARTWRWCSACRANTPKPSSSPPAISR